MSEYKNIQIKEVPSDWNVIELGDKKYFDLDTGGTPSTDRPEYWNGTIPWLSSGEVHKKRIQYTDTGITELGYRSSNASYIPVGSILIALAGQGKTRGTVAITKIKLTTNQSVAAVIPNQENVEPEFVYQFLGNEYEELRSASAGAGRAGLSIGILSKYKIIAPNQKKEQQKIAKILSTVDNLIEKTEELIEKYHAIKQGMMHDLFTRGIDTNGQLRPSHHDAPHLYKQTELGWIPKEWEVMQLGGIANYVNGNSFSSSEWRESGSPIIRIQNLNGDMNFNYYQGVVDPRWHIVPGDLVFAWAGQRGVSFGPRIWRGPEGVLNQHIFKVTPMGYVGKNYLYLALLHKIGEIEKCAHGFKDSFLHVTRGELVEIPVVIQDKSEQDRIVGRMTTFHEKLNAEQTYLEKIRVIKNGLMQDLLTGKVRVS